MSEQINYHVGSVLPCPYDRRGRILAHVVNDRGTWGKGFAAALAHQYPSAKTAYLEWWKASLPALQPEPSSFELGNIQVTRPFDSDVEPDLLIANMLAQSGLASAENPRPLNLDALDSALDKLARVAYALNHVVYMPRIGAGLARGKWDEIEPIIQRRLCDRGIEVNVYTLPREANRWK